MNWSYIAGFFDGEGSILFGRPLAKMVGNKYYRVVLAQKDLFVLEQIREFLLHYGIHAYIHTKKLTKANHSEGSTLQFSAHNQVAMFIKHILPDAVVKKKKLSEALKIIKSQTYIHWKRSSPEKSKMIRYEIIKLRSKGLTQGEIAEKVGVSQCWVAKILKFMATETLPLNRFGNRRGMPPSSRANLSKS